MKLVEKDLEQYIKRHSSAEDEILRELDRETNMFVVQPRMLSGHIQGLILRMIVSMLKPSKVLEIGTFTGYSAISMALGMDEGSVLHTVDINDEIAHIPQKFIERAGLEDKIIMHTGSALDIVPELKETFDLVFMDGDKREYTDYYEMLFSTSSLRSGSVILADNVLWDGKVVDESPKNLKDPYTKNILAFNDMVKNDPRVEVVILPFRDGMSVIKVK